MLRRSLWRMGFRYRLHARDVPGKPDIIFRTQRVVVFCDGDFWHGRNWISRRKKLSRGANAGYWVAKIRANIDRDRARNSALRKQGWTVLRVWETDIRRDAKGVATRVAAVIRGSPAQQEAG